MRLRAPAIKAGDQILSASRTESTVSVTDQTSWCGGKSPIAAPADLCPSPDDDITLGLREALTVRLVMPWSRSERLALASLLVALAGTVAALVVVPEVRILLALDREVAPALLPTNAEDPAIGRNTDQTTSASDPATPYRKGTAAGENGPTPIRAGEAGHTNHAASSQMKWVVSAPERSMGASDTGEATIPNATTMAGSAKASAPLPNYPFRISEIKLLAVFKTKRGLSVMFSGPDTKGYQARRGDTFADAEIIDIVGTTVQVQTASGAKLSFSVPSYDR